MEHIFTYRCGHTAVEDLVGSPQRIADARDYAERSRLCPACSARACAVTRQAEIALYDAQTQDYPALTGSAQQIAWATMIRGKLVERIAAMPQHNPAGIAELYAAIRRQTASGWWIEHRHDLDNPISAVGVLRRTDAPFAAYCAQRRMAQSGEEPPMA